MEKVFFAGILCVCLFNISCQRGTDCKRDCDKVLSKVVVSLKIDKDLYVDKYSNLYSNVQYVPLEETRNSIIGAVSALEIANDSSFIVFDNNAGAVFRFSPQGKFLNNVGFRGPGENEYILPMDVKYDPFYNKVLVWDNGKRSILTYGIDGKMEFQIRLPWYIYSFGIIDKDYLVCYMNNCEDIRGDEKGTNFKIIKRDGTIVEEFGEYGTEKSDFRPSAEHTFCFQNGRCLCFPPFSNTLYEMESDSMKAIATFDLLENAIPSEGLCGQYPDFRDKLRKYPDMIEISSVFESDQYYFLNMVKRGPALLCIINKETKKIRCLSSLFINDMYGTIEQSLLKYVYDNKLYFIVDPIEFEAKRTFLEKMPGGMEIKDGYMREKDAICSMLERLYGDNDSNIYIDSLKTTNFKLAPGEYEFIEEMSHKTNPIIQICTLK